jgi:hypothetical protein
MANIDRATLRVKYTTILGLANTTSHQIGVGLRLPF